MERFKIVNPQRLIERLVREPFVTQLVVLLQLMWENFSWYVTEVIAVEAFFALRHVALGNPVRPVVPEDCGL